MPRTTFLESAAKLLLERERGLIRRNLQPGPLLGSIGSPHDAAMVKKPSYRQIAKESTVDRDGGGIQ
jgi:hypothetical protein